MDIIERLRFDAARCELEFSKGIAGNIEEAAAEIVRLRAALELARDAVQWNDPEHNAVLMRIKMALAHEQGTTP